MSGVKKSWVRASSIAGAVLGLLVASCAATPSPPNAAASGERVKPMSEVYTASTVIRRPPEQVFEFARKPENQPRWAINFVKSTEPIGAGKYRMQTPYGPMTYRVDADPAHGTIDFVFDTPAGSNVLPARVVPHAAGSMFLFTITRAPQMDDGAWSEGQTGLDGELAELKRILEN
jgi:hypothetical protein